MIGGRAPSAYLQQLQTHEHVQLNDKSMDAILQSHVITRSTFGQTTLRTFSQLVNRPF
jgi:hypothetical protein